MNVLPAIVSVPLRLEGDEFASTMKPATPGPDPETPLLTVIQDALLIVPQAQPAPVVTVLLPLPPAGVNDWLVGEMLYEQLAPPWVTLYVLPAIVSVPLRLLEDAFASTLNPTFPLPEPVPPAVTVIHAALLVADQAQPPPAVTALLPVPPLPAKEPLAGEML